MQPNYTRPSVIKGKSEIVMDVRILLSDRFLPSQYRAKFDLIFNFSVTGSLYHKDNLTCVWYTIYICVIRHAFHNNDSSKHPPLIWIISISVASSIPTDNPTVQPYNYPTEQPRVSDYEEKQIKDRQLKRRMAESIIEEYSKKRKLIDCDSEKKRTQKYSSDIMRFALTLSGYSYKAYSYVRDVFDNSLPCKNTLINYLNKIDARPGFQQSSLFVIRDRTIDFQDKDKHLFVSLSVDDISIHKHVHVLGSKIHGYVDIGDGPQETLATDAMVIMATSVDSDFKIPIAFFW